MTNIRTCFVMTSRSSTPSEGMLQTSARPTPAASRSCRPTLLSLSGYQANSRSTYVLFSLRVLGINTQNGLVLIASCAVADRRRLHLVPSHRLQHRKAPLPKQPQVRDYEHPLQPRRTLLPARPSLEPLHHRRPQICCRKFQPLRRCLQAHEGCYPTGAANGNPARGHGRKYP